MSTVQRLETAQKTMNKGKNNKKNKNMKSLSASGDPADFLDARSRSQLTRSEAVLSTAVLS